MSCFCLHFSVRIYTVADIRPTYSTEATEKYLDTCKVQIWKVIRTLQGLPLEKFEVLIWPRVHYSVVNDVESTASDANVSTTEILQVCHLPTKGSYHEYFAPG